MIIGLDEVGWGCVAGPLTIAAVVLEDDQKISGVRDSKKYSSRNSRAKAARKVRREAALVRIVSISPQEIDRLGPKQAWQKAALLCATRARDRYPDSKVIMDGCISIDTLDNHETLPKADLTVVACAAASVIAKVHRDTYMIRLSDKYPDYQFHLNMGYGTPEHVELISKYGRSEVHRKSFRIRSLGER